MLLNHYYYIQHIDRTEEGGSIHLTLNPDHPVYKGHFPGQPVAPGVCSIQLVRECASNLLGVPVRFEKISACKFMLPIIPTANTIYHLSLSVKMEDEKYLLTATLSSEDAACLKIKGALVLINSEA